MRWGILKMASSQPFEHNGCGGGKVFKSCEDLVGGILS